MNQDTVLVRTAGTETQPGELKLYSTYGDTSGTAVTTLYPAACAKNSLDPTVTDKTEVTREYEATDAEQTQCYEGPKCETWSWSFTEGKGQCPDFTADKKKDLMRMIKSACTGFVLQAASHLEETKQECMDLADWIGVSKGSYKKCHRDTGGTCSGYPCAPWRNAWCDPFRRHGFFGVKKCVCLPGKCAKDGKCIPRDEI